MKYLKRLITTEVEDGLKNSPVTALIGPRQCGKSTLTRHLLTYERPFLYLDLEKPSDLRKLEEPEWFFISQKEKLICIDEVQRKPDIFPLIRSMVDETAGGFPRSLLQKIPEVSYQWREDFIATFLERDLLQWRGFSPHTTRRLWLMLAHNNGQMVNLSTIGGSLGFSHTTVRNYLDLLQETFMVHILPPFISNTGKRLVKTPKVYISDTGIISALLGLSDFNQLAGHPVFGSLWESMVITNLKGIFPRAELSFYRTSNGTEIDILFQLSGKLIAIECKASVAPTLSKGSYSAIEDITPLHTFVVAPVAQSYPLKPGISVVTLSDLVTGIRELVANN